MLVNIGFVFRVEIGTTARHLDFSVIVLVSRKFKKIRQNCGSIKKFSFFFFFKIQTLHGYTLVVAKQSRISTSQKIEAGVDNSKARNGMFYGVSWGPLFYTVTAAAGCGGHKLGRLGRPDDTSPSPS